MPPSPPQLPVLDGDAVEDGRTLLKVSYCHGKEEETPEGLTSEAESRPPRPLLLTGAAAARERRGLERTGVSRRLPGQGCGAGQEAVHPGHSSDGPFASLGKVLP